MNLLDKSLRLALLASAAALLTACPPDDKDADTGPAADADTDTDSDSDSDADTDTDTDADADTGIAALFWVAEFATTSGEFTSGQLGFGGYGIIDQDWVCTVMGDLAYEGEAAAGCPDCEWSFDLSAVSGSTMEGTYCDGFVDTIFADGSLDTYFDWSWGFASAYTYYGSDGTAYPLEETVFIDQDGTGSWGLFAFNYGTSFQMISGDASAVSIAAQASDGTDNIYYYYYR